MSVAGDSIDMAGRRPEGYRSPALSRLQEPQPRLAPIHTITGGPPPPASEALEARLTRLEQQQIDLAANLCQANTAFRRLIERLEALTARVEALGSGQAADEDPASALAPVHRPPARGG